ncbi:hypothetical protein AXG93_4421s1110 [Marchantia polymorpha subsp. ruderalis]|uniref:Ribonuclease H2 subunit B wHTH domain-containing protein n=1 Tax=Marchantia polymorpha subsp. ruderalis TaxID=1480154 RepID=A0A176WFH3_MARPO|nr:hypothetical protein AXG93_4421s1110 [Marchantia polymorpha subsp. ruderalis]
MNGLWEAHGSAEDGEQRVLLARSKYDESSVVGIAILGWSVDGTGIEVGDSKYYRLDDRKVLAWLLCKAKRISEDLRSTQKNLLNMSKEDMNSYVVGLLSEYLTAEPWLTKLCNSLSVERGASKIGHWVAPPEVLGVAPSQNTKHSGSSVGKGAAAKKGAPQGVRKITSFFARPR